MFYLNAMRSNNDLMYLSVQEIIIVDVNGILRNEVPFLPRLTDFSYFQVSSACN